MIALDKLRISKGIREKTSDEIKNNKKFKDWELVRISRLSVMPVPKLIWDEIIKISQD